MPHLCPSLMRVRKSVSGLRPMGKAVRFVLFLLIPAVFAVPFAWAEDGKRQPWQTVIEEHPAIPERLIAVDKSRQQLSLFERRSPLKLARLFTCTTGQVVGDKEQEGDLKTPEGIYFVVQRIGSGLEFLKYGTEAYTLNYPNPVDRLRKKTGYGIWIHGRGEPLAPLQTQGCVSMNNDDLATIGGVLLPGTPVALTESLSFSPSPNAGGQGVSTVSRLEKKTQAWAKAWEQRSSTMFDFYDKQSYGLAQGESFARFQAQKERLFKQLPWISNSIRDIRVLQGPGYWVTWFYQDYRAPNLSTSGVRRLYWAPDDKGDFKIVGMEWTPGMTTGTLLASAEPALPPIEAQPRTEEQSSPVLAGRVKGAGPAPAAPAVSAASTAGQPTQVPDASRNVSPPEAIPPGLVADASGKAAGSSSPAVSAPAREPVGSPSRADLPVVEKRHFADHVEDPREGKMAEPPQAARLMAGLRGGGAAKSVAVAAPAARQGVELPPALPSQGLTATNRQSGGQEPTRVSAAGEQGGADKGQGALLLSSAPPASHVPTFGPVVPAHNVEPGQDASGKGRSEDSQPQGQLTSAPVLPEEPARPLVGKPTEPVAGKTGKSAATTGASEPSSEDIASAISGRTEAWRKAWVSGDLDAYVSFYAPKARQGTRTSAEAIRTHKRVLWGKAAPASLALEDMRIEVQGSTATVSARQEYADSNGGGDRGLKTLIFENINGQWLVTQEKWSPLPDEAGN